MRMVVFSDAQYHDYKLFSENGANGISSRLQDQIDVLNQISDYAVKNKIGRILFVGDFLDQRQRGDFITIKTASDWINKVSNAGIIQHFVVGNHDQIAKHGTHSSLDLFEHIPNVHVIATPQWIDLGEGCGFLAVPYMNRLEEVLAGLQVQMPSTIKKAIAVIHYGLFDVSDGYRTIVKYQGYESEGQVKLSDLDSILTEVSHVLLGHYHMPTSVTDRVHFVGTPIQHNFGEASYKTRFLDVDLDTGKIIVVPTKAPKFVQFESPAEIGDGSKAKGNFVRVDVHTQDEKLEVEAKLDAIGVRGRQAILKPKVKAAENRLGLDLGMSYEEMGMKLVDADTETTLDKKRLKNMLVEVFKEAQQKKDI